MLRAVAAHFANLAVLVVTDSWFGNDGLLRPLHESGFKFDILSRLRSNITLYDLPPRRLPHQRGRSRKYGAKLGAVFELAARRREQAW